MRRWLCAALAVVVAALCAAGGLAEDYYDKGARVEADITLSLVSGAFDEAGEGELYTQREEQSSAIVYYSASSSLQVMALPDETWDHVAAYVVTVNNLSEYLRGLDAVCDIAASFYEIYDLEDGSDTFAGWLEGYIEPICRCGAENRQQKWSTQLEKNARAEISVTPLPDCTRLNAVLYITDDVTVDIYMGAGSAGNEGKSTGNSSTDDDVI